MAVHADPYESLQAQYRAATAQERSAWKALSDTHLAAAERGKAYARWAAAAERIKVLAIRMRDLGAPVKSTPS